MAITRCPYCHAIIDETDKYCNNCGTQLLFPDEDTIEEEIPGEKIIDAETEEKDYEIDEPGKVTAAGFVDEDARGDESDEVKTSELEEALQGEPPDRNIQELIEEEEPSAEAAEEDRLEEVILVEEMAAREAGTRETEDQEEELVVAPEAHPPTTAIIGEPAAEAGPIGEETPGEPFHLTAEEPMTPAPAASHSQEAAPEKEEETKAYLINPVPLDEHELESDEDESPAEPPRDEETAEIVGDEIVPAAEAEPIPPAEEPAVYEAPDESEAEVSCDKSAEEEGRTGEILAAEPEAEEAHAEPVSEPQPEPGPVHEPTPVTWHEPTPPPMREMKPEPEEATAEAEPAFAEEASKAVTFDTGELEGIGKTIDLSQARLDRMIEDLVEDREIEENLKAVPAVEPLPSQGPAPDEEPVADYVEQAVREPEPAQPAEPETSPPAELEPALELEPAREAEGEPVSAAVPLPDEELPSDLGPTPFREMDEEHAQETESVPRTGSLPPWASRMKGRPTIPDTGETGQELSPFEEAKKSLGATGPTPGLPEDAGTKEQTPDAEVEIFPHRKMPDSGIGLPERITQAALPFEATPAAAEQGPRPLDEEVEEALGAADVGSEAAATLPGEWAEEDEPVQEPAIEAPVRQPAPPIPPTPPAREVAAATVLAPGAVEAEEAAEKEPKPPFSLSLFAKSKVFDLLLVGVFWLVALWVAARSLGSTLFEMLEASPTALIGLFVVLVALYFFLFKFFLGETLGDRLFREREPADD